MRIAMMTNNYKPFVGGVPVSIERLSESLRRMGHKVVVFAPFYEGTEEERDVLRYQSFRPGWWGGIAVPNPLDPKIEKAFAEENFDVIHVHHPLLMGQTARYLSRKYKVPMVFTYHTRYEQYLHYVGLSFLKGILPIYMRNFCQKCDGVIAPTEDMREYLEGIGVRRPVTVLPTGISRESFETDRREVEKLRSVLAGEKRYLFLCVARLAREKNLAFLLECMAVYKKEEGNDFRLALIGEGPEEGALRLLAKELGIEENVLFLGLVKNQEISRYYAAADLFLFPSTTETQGIVSLEAMAAGTPVVAVFATGTRNIVEDGENGYMTRETAQDFCAKLREALSEKQLARLSAGARRTAMQYGEENVAHRAVACYQAVILERLLKGEGKGRTGRIAEVFGAF